jgi:hypothetical protein
MPVTKLNADRELDVLQDEFVLSAITHDGQNSVEKFKRSLTVGWRWSLIYRLFT